jgi:alpha-tubulin suppressor-like RCC1 family protein
MKRSNHNATDLGMNGRCLCLIAWLLCSILMLTNSAFGAKIVCWGDDGIGHTPPIENDYVAVAGSVALRADGSLVGWGNNDYGQATPPAGNDFVAIADELALRADGSLVAWGRNLYGQRTAPPGNDFVAIATSAWVSLALRADGSLIAWGCNCDGESNAPAGNDYIAIGVGDHHGVALRANGSIVCWGRNSYGSIWGQATPPPGNDFVAIEAGYGHNLALRSDGSIVTWGDNRYGLDNVPAGNDFVAIAAGGGVAGGHSLALRSDGSIVGWGFNYAGQATHPQGNDFVAIWAEDHHSRALRGVDYMKLGSLQVAIQPSEAINSGAQWRRVGTTEWMNSDQIETVLAVHPWMIEFKSTANWIGPNRTLVSILPDELKIIEAPYTYTPSGSVQVTILPAEAVVEGAKWRRVGTTDWLDSGQIETVWAKSWTVEFKPLVNWIGPNTIPVSISPDELTQIEAAYTPPGTLQVTILPPEAIAAGAQWRRVGTTDWQDSGQIETVQVGQWNVEFKLVANCIEPKVTHVTISPYGLTQIEVKYYVTYGGGSIVAWGDNSQGQATPPSGDYFVAIAARNDHSLALRADGSIVGWGGNEYGEVTPPAGTGFVAISTGYFHSLALRADGSIVGWGRNDYGQATPPAGNDFVAIAAGGYHSLALRANGSIVRWGEYGSAAVPAGNDFVAIAAGNGFAMGLRADGTVNVNWKPEPLWGGEDFVAIAAGDWYELGLRADGSVFGDDYNMDGQATPPAESDFVAIAACRFHSLGLRADGSIVGWGGNRRGQATPPTGNTFTAIAGGAEHSLALKKAGRHDRGDFDGDADVDLVDLTILTNYWLHDQLSADIAPSPDGDGIVNVLDFDILAKNWKLGIAPVSVWTFDGIWADSSDKHNGTAVGDPEFVCADQARIGSGAAQFDGDDMVRMEGYKGILGSQARTCTAWIKTTATMAPILYWGNKDVLGGLWELRISSSGQLRLGVNGGGVNGTTPINTGQWTHVAVVLPDWGNSVTDVLLYVNGVRQARNAIAQRWISTADGADFRIGANDSGQYFTGLIDDVRIYDRGLTSEEIATLANP